jgi:hypothetical protein
MRVQVLKFSLAYSWHDEGGGKKDQSLGGDFMVELSKIRQGSDLEG